MTAVLASVAWFWMPYGPGSAWFLNEQDRAYAAERIRLDNVLYIQHSYNESGVEKDTLTRRDAVENCQRLEAMVRFILQHPRECAWAGILCLPTSGREGSWLFFDRSKFGKCLWIASYTYPLTTHQDVSPNIRLRSSGTLSFALSSDHR